MPEADEAERYLRLVRLVVPLMEDEARRGGEVPEEWAWLDRRMWKHVYQGA